jgi:hypothetical protein
MKMKPIYRKHQGDRESTRLSVYPYKNGFNFVYEKFSRTNPNLKERKAGLKQFRILLGASTYFITDVSNKNLSKYPFHSMLGDYEPNILLRHRES